MNFAPKKFLKWLAISLAAIGIGIPLLLAVINAFDENLKPEVAAFADLSGDNVPDKDNGYFAWAGFKAAAGENPHAVGLRMVGEINQRLATDGQDPVDAKALLGSKALAAPAAIEGLCGRDDSGCLARYQRKRKEILGQVQEHKILLERYDRLPAFPEFRETMLRRITAPIVTDPLSVTRLARARHALLAMDGDATNALRRIRDDSMYWRRILAQSRGLVTRMIAVSMIQLNTQLVSEIVALPSMPAAQLSLALQAVKPLSESERNLTKVFRHEFGFSVSAFTDIDQYRGNVCPEGWNLDCLLSQGTSTFLFKTNATINFAYPRFQRLAEHSKRPAREWVESTQRWREDMDSIPFVWHIFYNPIGKILSSIAVPHYDSYNGRIHNLDGFLRLVSLQINAKSAGVREAGLEKYLSASPEEFRNPYTGEPMQWDVQARTLYFNGFNDQFGSTEVLSKRIEVRL